MDICFVKSEGIKEDKSTKGQRSVVGVLPCHTKKKSIHFERVTRHFSRKAVKLLFDLDVLLYRCDNRSLDRIVVFR